MYLLPTNQTPAGELVNSQLWSDIKRCLLDRRPENPDPKDLPHEAAAKGFRRAGYEKAIEEMEKLPFEHGEGTADPFARPAVSITED